MKKVVITGTGTLTPLANNARDTWERLKSGESGLDYVEKFDASGFRSQVVGEIKGFNGEALQRKYGPQKEVEMASDYGYVLSAVDEAITEAGMTPEADDKLCIGADRTGVLGFTELVNILKQYEMSQQDRAEAFFELLGESSYQDMLYFGQESCTPGIFLTRLLGLASPPHDIHVACATGAQVVAYGYDMIRAGLASRVICCTVQPLDLLKFVGFNLLEAVSSYNENPRQASRPFDKKRDGMVLAEGAAAVILEDMEQAVKRGVPRMYAEVAGYGITTDGYRLTDPDPDAQHSAVAMRLALDHAGLQIEDIDYINAHGTSTVENDRLETKAIKAVFGQRSYDLLINSTKSMTGHMLMTSGLTETIVTALSLDEGVLHPTINLEQPDAECDLNYLAGNRAIDASIKIGMTNSFGFGGHNISLILKKIE